jgi:hypothetical protein
MNFWHNFIRNLTFGKVLQIKFLLITIVGYKIQNVLNDALYL